MVIAFIALLIGLSIYLAMRLGTMSTENVSLRAQVSALKRQLVKRRP
jgi:uncharacterized membrane-anchored protein YhcB (DUF1043 family)